MRLAKLAVCLSALAGSAATLAITQSAGAQVAVGNTFTYQGRLDDNGQPANGVYDFQFQLAPAASGSFVGAAQTMQDVSVVNGLFTVKLAFGAAFTGDARFIEARVRPGVSIGAFTPLTPRQELTPAPYAVGLALPFSETQTNAASLFTLDQNGTGNCMTLTGTNGDALNISTDGTGDAIYAHTTGAGSNALAAYTTAGNSNAVYGQTTGGGIPIYGYNLGTSGLAAFFRTESTANASNCVEIQNNGTGVGVHASARADRAAHFENTTASNPNVVLVAENTGGAGSAIWAKTNGTGTAGTFDINNFASTKAAIEATTVGTGPAGKFNGRVDVNGKLNAQVGGVLNRATPIAWGRIAWGYPNSGTLLSSSGNVTVSSATGGWKIQVTGETNSGNWVILTSLQYGTVPDDHHWDCRTKYPALDGSFVLSIGCVGCGEFVSDSLSEDFVVYQGQ